MGQKQRRADLAADALQVRVGPCRQDVAIKARLGALAIPANAKAVTVNFTIISRFISLTCYQFSACETVIFVLISCHKACFLDIAMNFIHIMKYGPRPTPPQRFAGI